MIDIIQIILAILIIVLILLQQRGMEGGALFGSSTQVFFKKRGLEKNIYILTWIFIFAFITISIIRFWVK